MRGVKTVILLVIVAVISYGFYFFLFTALNADEDIQITQKETTYDLVIKHALILDGTGEKEKFRGDIAIKDSRIVEVGSVQERDFPTFDAGGLTVMPFPVRPVKDNSVVEHLFRTSYPRYSAHYLYFQDGPYQGFNLAQVSQQRGETPQKTFNALQLELPAMTKVNLVPLELGEESLPCLTAYLTGYPATALGKNGLGMIKPDYKADLYFFVAREYDEETLKQHFLKGELPEPALYCREGRLMEISEPLEQMNN